VQTLLSALLLGGCIFDTTGLTPGVDSALPEQTVFEGSNGVDGAVDTVDSGSGDLSPRPDRALASDSDLLASDSGPDTMPPDTKPAADIKPAPDINPAPDIKPAPDITPAPDQSPFPALCTAKYGTATSFYFCSATATSCTFYVKTNEDTCQNLCTSFGGSCLGGYDNSGYCNSTGQQSSCSWVHSTQICICSL
jgi:hypothetical protein